ncbi:hypothetical protein RRG08_066032 [Elysia crispata]|uniref:Uncharacterized protein n=1 Tax=Elysia crispata TaxID=231223 RepID=A0AAE0Y397_9GAST|nr:hypothetical protein RRG08_066032 [Elysia crispata]
MTLTSLPSNLFKIYLLVAGSAHQRVFPGLLASTGLLSYVGEPKGYAFRVGTPAPTKGMTVGYVTDPVIRHKGRDRAQKMSPTSHKSLGPHQVSTYSRE